MFIVIRYFKEEGKGCMHISICVKNEKILKTYAVNWEIIEQIKILFLVRFFRTDPFPHTHI